MRRPSSTEFARRLRKADGQSEVDALTSLLDDRAYAHDVLEGLASDHDPEVRHWVPDVAARVLGAQAAPLLLRLAQDRDSDVRIDALTALVAVAPEEARRLAPRLRRRVASTDFYEAQGAIWALGAIRDLDGLEVIRQAQRQDRAIPRNAAIAVELLLTDPEQLCRRIESHDHELMPWLTVAAGLLSTERARQALQRCADEAPDEECRRWAKEELAAKGG